MKREDAMQFSGGSQLLPVSIGVVEIMAVLDQLGTERAHRRILLFLEVSIRSSLVRQSHAWQRAFFVFCESSTDPRREPGSPDYPCRRAALAP